MRPQSHHIWKDSRRTMIRHYQRRPNHEMTVESPEAEPIQECSQYKRTVVYIRTSRRRAVFLIWRSLLRAQTHPPSLLYFALNL